MIGCQQHNYKAEAADEAAYSIIDQKWRGNFGSKALTENEVQWLVTDGTGKRNMQAVFIEPGKLGIRIEDDILVTRDGFVILGKIPRCFKLPCFQRRNTCFF